MRQELYLNRTGDRARAQFRRAQLQAKRNAEAAKRKERELLFSGVEERSASAGSNRRRGQEKLTEEELELNASNDVVAAMRRVHQSMQSELSRSQYANETLRRSPQISRERRTRKADIVTRTIASCPN